MNTQAWIITSSTGRNISIEALIADYPNLYAADESGWEIDPQELLDAPEQCADAGFGARDTRRILFWANEADGENDAGARSIAEARWEG